MFEVILDLVIRSMEDAFLEVGIFVGFVLLLFGFINFKKSGAFIASIEKSKKWQPVLGALLGLTPGCGGAIFIMPLFFKNAVTFGTVIATLVATMGDSAFVLIASHPFHYIIVSLMSLIVGIITGYAVDQTNLGASILTKYKKRQKTKEEVKKHHADADHSSLHYECNQFSGCKNDFITHIGHDEGDEIDLLLHHKLKGHQNHDTLGYKVTHKGFFMYWLVLAIALPFGVGELFQFDLGEAIGLNINIAGALGVIGTIFSIVMMIASKKFLGDDTHEETELKAMSLKETIIHNAQDTAFVITWVFVGFLAYELLVLGIGGGDYGIGENMIETALLTTGIFSVFIAASIGIIPGCGPQIIFVTLFTRDLVPFAALFANAISQDGDALLPLIAIDRPSALWATVITTVPGIVFGLLVYWFEIQFF
ncbi:putative manganese transporter [Natronincola ferrireducens]|uniref:Putative, 10TM heavy-metal exporter n=1 Tax=Natronincola ferrireducens TaxID=393762 RepID=A0A1G9H293_9FIRM|nr:putative manganese transporter [Natronincola ferrireducens]SDL07078.1 Putative, 10TM heavy-metal exporter [Natronincola ferrireducens]